MPGAVARWLLNIQRITRGSPDGEKVAFRSECEGGGVFVMGASGESVRRVTDFGYNPAWSPDGRRLVVATEAIETPFARSLVSELWTVEIATGEKKRTLDGDIWAMTLP
jgi:Tol biopolymer transport system component